MFGAVIVIGYAAILGLIIWFNPGGRAYRWWN